MKSSPFLKWYYCIVHYPFFELYIKIQGSLASLVFHERKHFLCSLEFKNATIGVVFLFLPLKPRNIFFFLHWDDYWTIRWPVGPETKIFIVCKYFYGGSGEERGGLLYTHRLPYNFFLTFISNLFFLQWAKQPRKICDYSLLLHSQTL